MPIETPHPLYAQNLVRWKRCRDAYQGEDAVKAAGEVYLPKIDSKQTTEEYGAYKTRALYYEAVSRTVDGFVGAISRKPHVFDLGDRLADLLVDATTEGTGLAEFVKLCTGEGLLQGRGGIMVDYGEALDRPYFSLYTAESIINWSDDGVVLRETVFEPDPADAFSQVAVDQIRQVRIEDGVCRVTVWRKTPNPALTDLKWSIYSEMTPTKRSRPLTSLPWFWLSPAGRTGKIAKPPLLGLVNVSMAHYRSYADLEHGRHWTALPTLYVTGMGNTDDEIRVGGGAVIKVSDPQGKVGYAEFTGQGLKSLEKAIEDKEQEMAVLGAAVFAGGKKGVEAAETARIRTSAENSLLMGIVSSVEETLTAALNYAAAWVDDAAPITVHLNRDFIDEKLDPQTLIGMVQALQSQAMSQETFTYILDQAGMLPPGTDLDGENASLAVAKAAAAAKVVVKPTDPAAPE
jgi:hypothetical protein